MIKFDTHTRDTIPSSKISKPEASNEIQDGRRRHLEFHQICCHFIANCPISTKFCTQMRMMMPQIKNLQPEVNFLIKMAAAAILEFDKTAITRANDDQF